MPGLVPFDEACERIFSLIAPLEALALATTSADQHVVVSDICARRTSPSDALSAMDGYAVRADDVKPGSPLAVVAHITPGTKANKQALGTGQCARIFTGATMPLGADSVLIQENTSQGPSEHHVHPTTRVTPGTYVRPRGLDFVKNDILVRAGTPLSPATIALLISGGISSVKVHRHPRVSIISTGDELIDPTEWTPEQNHCVPASNAPMLQSLLARHGYQSALQPIAKDDLATLQAQFESLINSSDFVISTGGASVGEYEMVRQFLTQNANDIHIEKIAMRPGKPVMLARLGQLWWLALPGNPVSSFVTGLVFGIGICHRLAGNQTPWPLYQQGTLAGDLPANDERLEFMRAMNTKSKLTPFDRQDSSMLRALALANALLVRPAYAPPARSGETVRFLSL